MRLFEAIVDANHRALAGDARAGLRPHEYAASLPLVALTCFDPRMHPLMPEVLGVAEPDFIWLANAGNMVTDSLSSTVRSLALACAVHGGKEIAILGHTSCRFFPAAQINLSDRLRALGLDVNGPAGKLDELLRSLISERDNVASAVRCVRASPLIGKAIPVHGLLVDSESGRLEWVVNGYVEAGLPVGTDYKIGTDLPPIGGG